jgi:hypothetical protein
MHVDPILLNGLQTKRIFLIPLWETISDRTWLLPILPCGKKGAVTIFFILLFPQKSYHVVPFAEQLRRAVQQLGDDFGRSINNGGTVSLFKKAYSVGLQGDDPETGLFGQPAYGYGIEKADVTPMFGDVKILPVGLHEGSGPACRVSGTDHKHASGFDNPVTLLQ